MTRLIEGIDPGNLNKNKSTEHRTSFKPSKAYHSYNYYNQKFINPQ